MFSQNYSIFKPLINHKSGDFRPSFDSLQFALPVLLNTNLSFENTVIIKQMDNSGRPIKEHTITQEESLSSKSSTERTLINDGYIQMPLANSEIKSSQIFDEKNSAEAQAAEIKSEKKHPQKADESSDTATPPASFTPTPLQRQSLYAVTRIPKQTSGLSISDGEKKEDPYRRPASIPSYNSGSCVIS